MKASQFNPCQKNAAFTLRELLVVIGVLALLGGLFVTTARSAATRRIKVAQCAANLRQFAQATQIYAIENRDRLPVNTGWAWDLPGAAADSLLSYGMERRTFYCPGTSPRFNDQLNYLNPEARGSLWNYFGASARIIGYTMAFLTPFLASSNQNTTILPEPPKLSASIYLPIPKNSERPLLADATISENSGGTPAAPAAAGSFTSVVGGFNVSGRTLPHISPHLKGKLPDGGNLAFKDGHVAWSPFLKMSQRASNGRGFWW